MADLESTVQKQAEPGLYEVMTQMQTVVHKMSYAIDAENSDRINAPDLSLGKGW